MPVIQLNHDIVMFGLVTADDAGKAFNYGPSQAGAPISCPS